jgi:hypothetical protein
MELNYHWMSPAEKDAGRGIICKCKDIPLTESEGPQGCETSRIPHFPDSRLTSGGEGVSLALRPPFTPQEHTSYALLLEAESTPGQQ